MLKKAKILLIISLIIISLNICCYARYYEKIGTIQGKGTIAEPIVIVEGLQDTINLEINKNTEPVQYSFVVKNYKIDSDKNKKISEVDFSYNIVVKSSSSNFPARFELYDFDSGEKISSENKFDILKNIEYEKKYKVIVYWNKLEGEMSSLSDVDILVNVSQKNLKKEIIN